VVRSPAREDHDAAQGLQILVLETESLEHQRPVAHSVADRLADRVRLLIDLLEHERLVTGLLGALVVPVELEYLVVHGLVVRTHEGGSRGCDGDDVAVVREHHPACLAEEGRRVGAEEHLAVGDADDERALEPGAHEELGMVVVDHDEGEVALELAIRPLDRLGEIAVVVPLDQMGDHLGVGLGAEAVALGLEALLELAVVLDDAVQDEREPSVLAARQRVRVLLGDSAVRRPARVAEPRRRFRAVQRGCSLQVAEVADGADVVEGVVLTQHDPGGVVTAVLEALEAVEKERLACPGPDVSDDSAHRGAPSIYGPLDRVAPSKRTKPGRP
jgi:hypothetical protein